MEQLKKLPKKATEESFNELHYLVTEDFLRRIRSGEATTQDLKAACDWLKINDTFVMYGQNICKPISPMCSVCKIKRKCSYYKSKKNAS